MSRRLAALVALLVVAGARPALAHGIGGRLDLPVPITYFAVGAGLVVVLTFAALAVLWPEPRLEDGPRSGVAAAPWLSPIASLVRMMGVLGLLLVIAAGLIQLLGGAAAQGPTIAPVTVWVVFWLVIPYASTLLGDIYTVANPWRTLARLSRLGGTERPVVGARIGVWPATGLFVAWAWLELIWPESGSAVTLGLAALLYTVVLGAAMALLGRETGLMAADVFTPYNRIFSAISPLGRRGDGTVVRRGWLRALPVLSEWNGLWGFTVVAIGTVSYDGLSVTEWWPEQGILGATLLLLTVIFLIGGAYIGAAAVAVRMTRSEIGVLGVAQRFAHTLVPIAIAYSVAHYFTLILFEGQQLISAASDPFGLGWNLFGTAGRKVDFFLRQPEPVWYLQVAVIVIGHVVGVVLAHDRALTDFRGRAAVRSQYAMLVLMVLLTGLGLVILAG